MVLDDHDADLWSKFQSLFYKKKPLVTQKGSTDSKLKKKILKKNPETQNLDT